jgi:adenylate cyclase
LNAFLNRLGLRFADPKQEADFLHYYLLRHRVQLQAAFLAGGVLFYIFFIWDKIIDPANAERAQFIRGVVTVPLIWACAAALQIPSLRKHLEYIATIGVVIPCLSLSTVYYVLDGGFDYGAVGIVLMVLFCTALIPIRAPFFVFFCVVALASFFGAELASTTTHPGMMVVNVLALGTAVLLGTASVIWRELTARSEFAVSRELENSRARVNELLHSMLPSEIVHRIQKGETKIADAYGEVSLVFADMVGFTELSRRLSPGHLVEILNDLFSKLDEQADIHGLERIKTIGDAYMAVGGLAKLDNGRDHAHNAANFALAIQGIASDLAERIGYPVNIRVGLHIGPVIAGVIGTKRPAFDCWGEAVNLASRLEHSAHPGSILISESAYWRLRDRFAIQVIDDIDLKGIGPTKVFLLERTAAALAQSPPHLRVVG